MYSAILELIDGIIEVKQPEPIRKPAPVKRIKVTDKKPEPLTEEEILRFKAAKIVSELTSGQRYALFEAAPFITSKELSVNACKFIIKRYKKGD